jgi:hypothetical protein
MIASFDEPCLANNATIYARNNNPPALMSSICNISCAALVERRIPWDSGTEQSAEPESRPVANALFFGVFFYSVLSEDGKLDLTATTDRSHIANRNSISSESCLVVSVFSLS